jgi:hypothetical protein
LVVFSVVLVARSEKHAAIPRETTTTVSAMTGAFTREERRSVI